MANESAVKEGAGKLDFGRMSFDQILTDQRVPQSFRSQIMLQLQRTGASSTLIRIADFDRLSVSEEITKKRKATEELLNKKANFEEQKRIFLDILHDEKEKVSKEIDNVNDLINTLNGKKKHKDDVKKLKNYRDDLRGYLFTLGWFVTQTTATRSMSGLRTLMRQFGSVGKAVIDNRDKIFAGLAATAKGVAELSKLAGQGLGHVGRMAFSFF